MAQADKLKTDLFRPSLGKRVEAHNQSAFAAALDQWFTAMMPMVGNGRWIPKSLPSRILARHPAPQWPAKTWQQALGDPAPEATLRKRFGASNVAHREKQREEQREAQQRQREEQQRHYEAERRLAQEKAALRRMEAENARYPRY